MDCKWGVYVHVPWCRRRCRYCDFYFEIGKSEAGFADKILQEYAARKSEFPSYKAETLYFGGGTPSSLDAHQIKSIVGYLMDNNILSGDAEVTMEANPEDMNDGYLVEIKKAGVNRLSIGVQSFEPSILRFLSRKHSPEEAQACIVRARANGFKKISVDFILGVPGENREEIVSAVEWCREQGINHFSAYLLTVEENTPLHKSILKGRTIAPDEDEQANAYEFAQELFERVGCRQYEVSSHCVAGEESRHNRIYWSKGMYLGLGPGAHSMRILTDGSLVRRANVANLTIWGANPAAAPFTEELLQNDVALLESMAFGIRDMVAGIDLDQISCTHQCIIPRSLHYTLKRLSDRNLLDIKDNRVFLTKLGARFADLVAREILGAKQDVTRV